MTDCLVEIGKTGRSLAIIGMGVTSAILAAMNLLVVVTLIDGRALAEIRGPLIGSGLIFGLLALASVWMLLRLLRGKRSSNKVTMMPALFIQVFGVLFGTGIVIAAVIGGEMIFLGEGVGIAMNMIFVPWLLRRRSQPEALDENGPPEASDKM